MVIEQLKHTFASRTELFVSFTNGSLCLIKVLKTFLVHRALTPGAWAGFSLSSNGSGEPTGDGKPNTGRLSFRAMSGL